MLWYPPLLVDLEQKWLERNPPPAELTAQLLAELRRHLLPDGFNWLAACAVYPQLHWNLTLYFGEMLTPREGREDILGRLVGLPWLRAGFIPEWLRKALVLAMPASKRHLVREVIEDLLLTALANPADSFQLEIATRLERGSWEPRLEKWQKWALQNVLRRETEDSPLSDFVLLSFLAGREQRDLSPAVPKRVSRKLRQSGTRWVEVGVATAAIALSGALGYGAWMMRPAILGGASVILGYGQGGPQPSGRLSRWLSSQAYQREFDRQNARHYYPAKVEGRLSGGQSEFRGEFRPYPPGPFAFVSSHGMSEDAYRREDREHIADHFGRQSLQSFVDASGSARYQVTWIKGKTPAPQQLSLTQSVAGTWKGTLPKAELPLIFTFKADGSGMVNSIKQNFKSAATIHVNGNSFTISVPEVGGIFTGTLDDGTLTGTWNQRSGYSDRLLLKKE
jgi:hypothetical protein